MNEKLLYLANSLVSNLVRLGNLIEVDDFCDRCSDEVLAKLNSDLDFIMARSEELSDAVFAEIYNRLSISPAR